MLVTVRGYGHRVSLFLQLVVLGRLGRLVSANSHFAVGLYGSRVLNGAYVVNETTLNCLQGGCALQSAVGLCYLHACYATYSAGSAVVVRFVSYLNVRRILGEVHGVEGYGNVPRAFGLDEDGLKEIGAGGLAVRVRGHATAIAKVSDHVYLSRIRTLISATTIVYEVALSLS